MQQDENAIKDAIAKERAVREHRKLNIIVGGLDIKNQTNVTLAKMMRQMFQDGLGVNTNVTDVCFLKKNLFKIRVSNFWDKNFIIKNRSKLSTRGMRIVLFPDRTRRDRHIHDLMRLRADEERQNGNIVKLGYRTMIINGVRYVWDDIKNMLVKALPAQGTNNTVEWI